MFPISSCTSYIRPFQPLLQAVTPPHPSSEEILSGHFALFCGLDAARDIEKHRDGFCHWDSYYGKQGIRIIQCKDKSVCRTPHPGPRGCWEPRSAYLCSLACCLLSYLAPTTLVFFLFSSAWLGTHVLTPTHRLSGLFPSAVSKDSASLTMLPKTDPFDCSVQTGSQVNL